MYRLLKDLMQTVTIGLVLGVILMGVTHWMGKPVPNRPEHRPLFIVGIALFSLVFRLLWHVRDTPE